MVSARTPKFGLAKLLITGFALVAAFIGSATQASAADDAGTSGSLVNQARSSHGLSGVARNGCLDAVAQKQAQRMADKDAIFHNSNLKGEAAHCPWELIGENVGVGPNVGKVHEAFMASSGHKANVLYTTYDAIGVGIARNQRGEVFVAHVFADLAAAPQPAPKVETPAPATAAPSAAPAATSTPTVAPSAAPATQAPVVEEVKVQGTQQVNTVDPNAVIGGVVSE